MDSKDASQPTQADLERDLGFLVHDVARLLRRGFDRRVRRLGITRAQWFVVAYLHRKDGQRQKDLADELDMEMGPLGKLLDRLEAGGWVKRKIDPADRRVTRVYKTAKIDPLLAGMRSEAHHLYDVGMADMSASRRELLIELLRDLRSNLLAEEE